MTFTALKRDSMDMFAKIQPYLSDPRPGHVWTARLELWGIIEMIESWIEQNGNDLEAEELRQYFKSLPAARYTAEECCAALKEETMKWKGK